MIAPGETIRLGRHGPYTMMRAVVCGDRPTMLFRKCCSDSGYAVLSFNGIYVYITYLAAALAFEMEVNALGGDVDWGKGPYV